MMAGRTDLIYIYLIYLTNKRCFWVGWLGAKLVGCVGKHMQRRETLAKTWSRVALLPLFVLECLLPFTSTYFLVLFLLQIPHPDPVRGHMDAVGLGRENTNE